MTRLAIALVLLAGCSKKDEAAAPPAPPVTPTPQAVVTPPAPAPTPAPPPAETPKPVPVEAPEAPKADEGTPPADGKYERVKVEGTTVPMINVMEHGTVVLVDTDGKKPRTWEEQYKRKKVTGKGQFDVHKTDANHDGKFDDDQIDREGLWVIDDKGNITKH